MDCGGLAPLWIARRAANFCRIAQPKSRVRSKALLRFAHSALQNRFAGPWSTIRRRAAACVHGLPGRVLFCRTLTSVSFAVFARGHPDSLAESGGKGALFGVAAPRGDLADSESGSPKQIHREGKPAPLDLFPGRMTELLPEPALKGFAGGADLPGEFGGPDGASLLPLKACEGTAQQRVGMNGGPGRLSFVECSGGDPFVAQNASPPWSANPFQQ